MRAVEALTTIGLFRGQSRGLFHELRDLAEACDAAERHP
jgi:hypothetical protein